MPQYFTAAAYRTLARLGSPGLAKKLDAVLGGTQGSALVVAAVSASATGVYGQLAEVDATAANVTITAPNPAGHAGDSWGVKLVKTASSHTLGVAAHASETFDGGAAPSASSTVGAEWVYESDGTNWVETSKI